jgi:hypothetical protein
MATPQPPRPQWRKSSHSANSSTCVEVATNLPATIAVRDSQHPDGPALTFSHAAWASFVARIRQAQT